MRINLRSGFLWATALPCLLAVSSGQTAFTSRSVADAALTQGQDAVPNSRLSQAARRRDPGYTYLNCEGTDAECLISETPAPGVRIVRPSDYPKRPAHYLSSSLYTTLAGGRETGNKFVAFDFQTPAGAGPLAHTHKNEWESFFVSDGTITFVHGPDPNPPFPLMEEVVPAQGVLYGPQGPVHGFQNHTQTRARLFSFAMPAGLDMFFHTSGSEVVDFNAPIPPISIDEITRTAFWAEQRGDSLWPVGQAPPNIPASTPAMVVSMVNDTKRPMETGPFGETRRVLLTPGEVGNLTGATAFCGPGRPGRFGGTVKYSYLMLDTQRATFPSNYSSPNTGVFYVLSGTLSMNFGGLVNKTVTLETGTFVQIEPGIPYSLANLSVSGQAATPVRAIAIDVIPPDVCLQ